MKRYSFGPSLGDGHILFRLWAPLTESINLRIDGQPDRPMRREAGGWHTARVERDGSRALRYRFLLEDGTAVPDPASRFQPQGPHGPSETVDLEGFPWQAADWKGRPWEETVLYELHVGTFTPEGTYAAAAGRLDHLAALGVTALQLMPLNCFSGRRGWGYDGVLPYAPFQPYGRPEDLQRFIDAAHRRGLSVFIDAVYNHFGPDGNFMPAYAPVFSQTHASPWGQGINLDGEGSRTVRDFFIENALYWLDLFRFDGIRFDAVHALCDDSEVHFLEELAIRVRAGFAGRHIHLILENEDNDSDLLERGADGKARLFTAQWNDDAHHALHVAATGEKTGYYADYADGPGTLGRALAEGFVFQGEVMPYRGSPRGKPSLDLPPTAFIAFLQNHDQIGNRAHGDRLGGLATAACRRALAAIYLLLPQIPMLFMGEEWDCRQPFPYFCDFDEALNRIVREGRRKEMARLPGFDGKEPDPTAAETFDSARLDRDRMSDPENAAHLAHYRALLDVRRRAVVPLLSGIRTAGRWRSDGALIQVEWTTQDGKILTLIANTGDRPASSPFALQGEILWREGEIGEERFGSWAVSWTLGGPHDTCSTASDKRNFPSSGR